MARKKYSILVILYTVFNIGILIGANNYIQQNYRNELNNKTQVNSTIIDKEINEDIDIDLIKLDNENKNEKTVKNNAENENQISTNKNNKSYIENTQESDEWVSKYTTSYNAESTINTKLYSQQRIKVFKVTAEEIIGDLNTIEKAKILWVCRKLSKKEYNEIEEYLSYSNEKLGVMKVHEILQEKLDDKSLEEVKEIFSKYIDTEKVKEIY